MTERDRRALIILGVIAGLAVVIFVLLKVLGGGGGGDEAAVSPPPAASTGSGGVPQATPQPTPKPKPKPEHVPGFSGRNPFAIPSILNTASPTAAASGSGEPSGSGTSAPPTTPGTSGTGGTTGTGGTAGTSPTAPTGEPQSLQVGGHTVRLEATFVGGGNQRAQIDVDGSPSVVLEGSRFAQDFRLVSVTGACARISFGDQAATLCTTS